MDKSCQAGTLSLTLQIHWWRENKLPQAEHTRLLWRAYPLPDTNKMYKKDKPNILSTRSIFIKVIGKFLISFEEGNKTVVAGTKFYLC